MLFYSVLAAISWIFIVYCEYFLSWQTISKKLPCDFKHILTYGFGAWFWMCMWIWIIESDVTTWASKWVFLIHSKLTWIWPWGSRLGLRKYSSNHLPILTHTDFLPADSTNGLARWWKIKNDSIMWNYNSFGW